MNCQREGSCIVFGDMIRDQAEMEVVGMCVTIRTRVWEHELFVNEQLWEQTANHRVRFNGSIQMHLRCIYGKVERAKRVREKRKLKTRKCERQSEREHQKWTRTLIWDPVPLSPPLTVCSSSLSPSHRWVRVSASRNESTHFPCSHYPASKWGLGSAIDIHPSLDCLTGLWFPNSPMSQGRCHPGGGKGLWLWAL